MQREKRISTDALAVLSECAVAGNAVQLPPSMLDRKLYMEVNAVLEGIGGKWNKKAKAHLFNEPEPEIADLLEGCIQTGLAVPLSRNGYFPTPPDLADYVVRLAEIEDGNAVLEPSAGTGNIVEAVVRTRRKAQLAAVENDPKLLQKLALLQDGQNKFACEIFIVPSDFLQYAPGPVYDRIVMNPPFSTKGAPLADIDHIMHAWELLKPGGRLVSIASASLTFRREKKAVDFREHVARYGSIEELPEKSFKESGTLTRTVIVVLVKLS